MLSFQRKYEQIVSEFDSTAQFDTITDPSLYLLVAKARVKCNDNRGISGKYLIIFRGFERSR